MQRDTGCRVAILAENSFIGSRPVTPWCSPARSIVWPGSSPNPNWLSPLGVHTYNRLLVSVLPSEAGVPRRVLMDTLHRVGAGLEVPTAPILPSLRPLHHPAPPHP